MSDGDLVDLMPSPEGPDKVAWPGRSKDADWSYGVSDPMRITSLLVMDDERLEQMTVYQGFGRGWEPLLWALHELVTLPATVLEPAWPMEGLLRQRMGGANHQAWMPLMISALEQQMLDEVGFCVVIFTGTSESARRVSSWVSKQPRPVLHVSTQNVAGAVSPSRFGFQALREHCSAIYLGHAVEISPDRAAAARAALDRWSPRETIPIQLDEVGHNCVTANHMVLRRAFRSLGEPRPNWSSIEEDDYTRVIVKSTRAVIGVRRSVPDREWSRLYIPYPAVVLTEPALFRFAYGRGGKGSKLQPATLMMIRRMQQQTGLMHPIDRRQMEMLAEADDEWKAAIRERQVELATQTYGIGLMAAQSCSAVIRLRQGVNHVFQLFSEYARSIRADNPYARRKAPQLLRRAQDALARAVGSERIDLIKECGGPVKIVSDAPLELLPIDGLPLAMRYDTSRINATPGNLLMGQLISRLPVTILHDDLTHVLVISAFSPGDRLRDDMANAMAELETARPGRFKIDFVRVTTVDEFVDVLNETTATIMVFDGHGFQNRGDLAGGLWIGEQAVDIWSLRPRVRVPPIIILSACDTQGLDAPSHVTAGNSFIALGAVTVLSTLLPVGGAEGALLVYRLLLHLSDFVPAAIEAEGRAMSWTAIMAGALRLTMGKDLLDHLEGRGVLETKAARGVFQIALRAVVRGGPNWFDAVREAITASSHAEPRVIDGEMQAGIAFSEAIRYVQLGNPERITVGSRELMEAFFPFMTKELAVGRQVDAARD